MPANLEQTADWIEIRSIVAIGSFNPSIFQPFWMSSHSLIRDEEAASADVKVVHSDAAVFNLPWLSIQVTQNRFIAETRDASMLNAMRDLVDGIFTLLEHTPITAIGFNSHVHCPSESDARYSTFFRAFAPRDRWEPYLSSPEMCTIMVEGVREGRPGRKWQIRVQPSKAIDKGLQISVNEHFDIKVEQESARTLHSHLEEDWESFVSDSAVTVRSILKDHLQAGG